MTETLTSSRPAPENASLRPDKEWVTVARVVRPQGCRGELLAELLTDFPERFRERRRLFVRVSDRDKPYEVTVERHWLHKGRLVLKLAGVDSMEAVDLLRGQEIVIPRAERAPIDEDSVYIGDLVGCAFYDRATARVVGEIVDVDRESSNMPLIVVRTQRQGGELLIPFAKAYQPHIDLEGRRMYMTLPEGLLALNEPLAGEEKQAAKTGQVAQTGGTDNLPGSTGLNSASIRSSGTAAGPQVAKTDVGRRRKRR